MKKGKIDDAPYPQVCIRGVNVPLYSRIINYGISCFVHLSGKIDALPDEGREWRKVNLLVNEVSYLDFLAHAASSTREIMVKYLNDFLDDQRFRAEFSEKLVELDQAGLKYAGDMRFNALSLYCLVRALRPERFVETGVALGKSSAMILLAMAHNQTGRLISIDLPNPDGSVMADGSCTSTGKFPVGWLIPDYLKTNWKICLGDSLEILPSVAEGGPLDGFLHDSLHTEEHAAAEFKIISKSMQERGMWLCDNIESGAGAAFSALLARERLVAAGFRDFAAVRRKHVDAPSGRA